MEYLVESEKETKRLAHKISLNVKEGDVFTLYGDLGSGKTTFTRYLVEYLGINSRVQSPTFVIVRRYESNRNSEIKIINHIDLYRLTTIEEVVDLGLEEYFDEKGSITIIEWPEIAEDTLPVNVKKIYFEYIDDNKRKIICIDCI